ncbi:LysR family transcriptional regulator [Nioella nitratireducens]|uniref:LysR family transcriptional regulator n=1 Tax=Nioella nitratireducens TaxID=1287720 RepID=UPI0008FD7983
MWEHAQVSFSDWDEIRTAYQVARMGTVSGAAEVLGVHHATVIRHIDSLEARLGAKLFQRHARGYTPTEAGQDLLAVGARADDQFGQLASRIRGRGNEVTGDLRITSLSAFAPLVVPALGEFQEQHPGLEVQFLTDMRLYRLEYGEAHVAIRAGRPGDNPDNIVQPYCTFSSVLCATKGYLEQFGPLTEDNVAEHRFIGTTQETPRAPFLRWLVDVVPPECIRFKCNDTDSMEQAVKSGMGIGFVSSLELQTNDDLVEMLPPLEEWTVKLWLVTHMDLHRTAKVQTVLRFLKEKVQQWPVDPA